MNYIIIRGKNGNRRSIPSSNNADIALREYNASKYEITTVALGPSDRYAVCNQLNSSKWCMKQTYGNTCFHSKMKSITISKIKQISFGPNNSYAIVMKSGFCHCLTLGGSGSDYDRSGPWEAIEKHQNNISYVGMTANKHEWIVGYGTNGYVSRGLSSSFSDQLREARSDGTIKSVSFGRENWYYVIHSNSTWYYNGTDTFKTAMKACRDKKVVAIW